MKVSYPKSFGNVVFCDDIRVEASGKWIFVGVYGGDIVIYDKFPIIIPQLSLHINYAEKVGLISKSLEVQVYLPGDLGEPRIKAPIDMSQFRSQTGPGHLDRESTENLYHNATMQFSFAPFPVSEKGKIKVRIKRDKDILPIGSKYIVAAESST